MSVYAIFKIKPENELRVAVVDEFPSFTLELINGLAEIYGTEMKKNTKYKFRKCDSLTIFSWTGCSIRFCSAPSLKVSIASETFTIAHAAALLHSCLEHMRSAACESEDRLGPTTLVVGPQGSGKSTLCRFLLNYAARLGRKPLLVDLDFVSNSLTKSGYINILNIEKPADIVDGFDQGTIRNFSFGYEFRSLSHLMSGYLVRIRNVGETVEFLRKTNENFRVSGVIIDTSYGSTSGLRYKTILHAACAFKIDRVVVLIDERLYVQLKKDMPTCVEVLYMPVEHH